MRFNLVTFLLVFQFAFKAGSAELVNIRSYQDLETLLSTKPIKTIDDLLHFLPDKYKNGHALIYNTQALGQNLVSPARPRILFFGTSGEFMMSVNSHPSGGVAQAGEIEKLETIEFSGDRTYLREIEFDGLNSPLSKPIEINPVRCTNCHGVDPRGLWDPYNMWPGVYGSLSRGRVDFISLTSKEHEYFQTFLQEKKTNPRYSFIKHEYKKLSELDPSSVLIPYDPKKMQDALVIQDGHTTFPNQIIGIIIGDFNLKRLGRTLVNAPTVKREKIQYLLEAVRRDEAHFLNQPGFIDLNKFERICSKNLGDFFPDQEKFKYVEYAEFHKYVMEMNSLDHIRQKKITNQFNVGLTGKSTDFNEEDPFDLNTKGAGGGYIPVSLTHIWEKKFNGRLTASFMAYVFYLSGLPYQELSTSVNAGRFNLYYGNSIECSGNLDNSGGRRCFYHGIDIFFERFLPQRFFPNPKVKNMSCEELATRSKKELEHL